MDRLLPAWCSSWMGWLTLATLAFVATGCDAPVSMGQDAGGGDAAVADAPPTDGAAHDASVTDAARENDGSAGLDASGPDGSAPDACASACGGVCVDLLVDVAHCGACGVDCRALPGVQAASVSCAAGLCVIHDACADDHADCSGGAADGCETDTTSPSDCGGCDVVCDAPAHATATCDGVACDFDCLPGFARVVDACVSLPAPRPIAPLSTSTATSRRPTFHWEAPSGTDGARVELCRDRACTMPIVQFDATGTSGAPAADLPTGVVFWRLHGRNGATTGGAVSPTWQLSIGARTAPRDTSWGTTFDGNGDGFADVVVGAPGRNFRVGEASIYAGSASGVSMFPTMLTGPFPMYASFGVSLASAGDVDGDGFSDLIVGANDTGGGTGSAYLYLGGPLGVVDTVAATLIGPEPGGNFGQTVRSAGDVDGDGYADVIVGAANAVSGAGRVYVYRGGASGLHTTPATILVPTGGGSQFGSSVSSAGDWNADGYGDVVVASVTTGNASVYLGSASGLAAAPSVTLTGTGTSLAAGSIACAGDVDGNGYADVVAMAAGARIYYSTGALGTSVGLAVAGTGAVAGAGDVDGDGYDEILAGSRLYYGGATGIDHARDRTLLCGCAMDEGFGEAVAGAGDTNADGFADLIVGAPRALTNRGVAFVYRGDTSGLEMYPSGTFIGTMTGGAGFFGTGVTGRN